jgi:hypothetical protein
LKKWSEKKKKKKQRGLRTYWEFVGRGWRRREVDVEGHGTAQCGTEMLVPLVVTSKHL